MSKIDNTRKQIIAYVRQSEDFDKAAALDFVDSFNDVKSVITYVSQYYKKTETDDNGKKKHPNEEKIAGENAPTNRQMIIAYQSAWKRACEVVESDSNLSYQKHHQKIKQVIEDYFADAAIDIMLESYKGFADYLKNESQEQAEEDNYKKAKGDKPKLNQAISRYKKKIASETDPEKKAKYQEKLDTKEAELEEVNKTINAYEAAKKDARAEA